MEITQSVCENNGTDIFSDGFLSDLEDADNIPLLSEDPKKLQVFSDRLNDRAGGFGCVLHYRRRIRSKTSPILTWTEMHEADRFSFLDSGVSYIEWNTFTYEEGFNRHSSIWGTCGIRVTFGCRSKVEDTQQQWGQYWYTVQKHGSWEQKRCQEFRCLNTINFVVLVQCERISSVTKRLGVRYWVLGFNL